MSLPYQLFPIDQSPGFIIHKMDSQLAAGLQREFQDKGYPITPEHWGVLSKLWEKDGTHQSELAERINKDRHNMSRIVTLLEKNGFIVRKHQKDDKRRLNVFLTPKGRSLQKELTQIVRNYVDRIFRGLTEEDLRIMDRVHRQIIKNIHQG
jgi:DNA-binding MarR family transcriptional regulator